MVYVLKYNNNKNVVVCTNAVNEVINLKDTFDKLLNEEFPFEDDAALVRRDLELESK